MKPTIAVTMGDPAGIGPEIVVKALASKAVSQAARCVVFGSRSVLEETCRTCGIPCAVLSSESASVTDVPAVESSSYDYGRVCADCGRAAFRYIEQATMFVKDGGAQAIATAPVNKESLRAGGIPYTGHTEIFGALTGTDDPLTLFEAGRLRIFFLTRHVPLRRACDLITRERVADHIVRCTDALSQLGITEGTMAVAALNPHSGEHGLFGTEETEAIAPAVEELKSRGYDVAGPVSADSVFHLALQGKYNSVLSLYHDQGHIAAKTHDFERTISITCGMPVLRTSVDHGTAFDIAGRNRASAVSMIEAIRAAARYAPRWNKGGKQ